jgi:hypothetical protein
LLAICYVFASRCLPPTFGAGFRPGFTGGLNPFFARLVVQIVMHHVPVRYDFPQPHHYQLSGDIRRAVDIGELTHLPGWNESVSE